MHPLLKAFFFGFGISFLGSLPLGSLNIAAMQISITDGSAQALQFAVGILISEMVYVRISLVAIHKIREHKKLLKAFEWITLMIIVALAIFTFIAAAQNNSHARNVLLSNSLPRFVLGLLMSALNPVQIPFWFGWSTVLFNRKILLPQNVYYNIYIIGIGAGTFAGSSLFIFGGHLMIDSLNAKQNVLSWIIGGIFSVTALILFIRLLRHKDSVQKI